MRALPIIERVLIAVMAVVVLFVLALLLIWHLQWLKVLRIIAANPPRADIAALAKTLPEPPELSATGDAALTADAWAWKERNPVQKINWLQEEPWLMGGMGPLPDAETNERFTANDHIFRELKALLARGYRSSHPIRLEPGREYIMGRDYNFIVSVLKPAAEHWRTLVRRDLDPGVDLDAIDALVATRSFPDDPNALGEIETIADIRDKAYLVCAVLGRVSAERLRRWQDEPDQAADRLLVALEYQRCILWPYWEIHWLNRPIPPTFDPGVILRYWPVWLNIPNRLELELSQVKDWENALLVGNSWTPEAARHQSDLFEFLNHPFLHDFQHRLSVLATQVLAQLGPNGVVPADPVGLDFAPGTDGMALQYLRLSDRSFAIVADPVQSPFITACLVDNPPKVPDLTAPTVSSINPISVVVVLPK